MEPIINFFTSDFFTGKYGLDWAAGIFMGLMLWRLGNHKRDGFIWSMLAAAAWIGFNIVVESAPGILINAVMFVIAWRSWLRWSGPPHQQAERPDQNAPVEDQPAATGS